MRRSALQHSTTLQWVEYEALLEANDIVAHLGPVR